MQTIKPTTQQCEKCLGTTIKKNGFYKLPNGDKLQKWLCVSCNRNLTHIDHKRESYKKQATHKSTIWEGRKFVSQGFEYTIGKVKALSGGVTIRCVHSINPDPATWMYEDTITVRIKINDGEKA